MMRWFSNAAWCGLALLLSASATQMQEPTLSDSHMDILRALSPEAKPASTPGAKPGVKAPAAVDKPLAVEATAPAAQPRLEKATEAVAAESSASTSGSAPSSKGLSDTQADLLNSLGAHGSASSSVTSADAVRVAHEQRDELEMEKEVAELKAGETNRKSAEEAKKKAVEEAAQRARQQAEEAAKEEAAKKAVEEAKAKAEAEEAKRKAEEVAKKAAEVAKAKAELEAQRKAAAEEAKRRQEEAARLAVEEAKSKAEEEAKREQVEKDRLMEIARVRLIKEQKEKAERDARAKRAAAAREAAAERAEERAAELTEQARKAAEKLKNSEMKRAVAEEDKRLQKLAEEKERSEAAEQRMQLVKEAAEDKKQEKASAQASVKAAFQAAIERSKEDARRQKEQKDLEAKQAAAKAEKTAALKVKRLDDRRQAILKRREQHKKEQAEKTAAHIHWGGKSKEETERRAKLEAIKKELEEDSAYARAHARREEMREAALKKQHKAHVEKVDTESQAKDEAVKEKERQDAIEAERVRRVQEAEALRKKREAAEAAAAKANVDDSTADSPMYDNVMVENQTLHAPLGDWGKEQGTIHFMFLIEDTIPHAGVWDHFFKGAGNDESYKIWVHCSGDPENCKDGFSSLPNAVQVETVPSYYCHDLVTSMVQVMRSATKSSRSQHDKYVFVSESTLPVKPFKTVQATLLADHDSDLCIFPQNHWGKTTVDGHGFPEATALRGHTSGATAYLIKHHQWVILSHDHATSMVQKWNAVDSKGHWSVSMHGRTHDVSVNAFTRSEEANYCTDEWAFFATLFGAITVDDASSGSVNIPGLAGGSLVMKGDKTADVQGRCHTFAFFESAGPYFNKLAGQIAQGDSSVSCYPHCWQHPMAISQISSAGLSAIRQSPFLFARKFPSDFKVTPEFYKTILG